jgi:hypothetical protein
MIIQMTAEELLLASVAVAAGMAANREGDTI